MSKKRIAKILKPVLVLALLAGAAQAQDATERIVRQLQAQGYKSITVKRTFLGRTRVNAVSDEFEREIVINPASGEILRDYSAEVDDDGARSEGKGGSVVDPEDGGGKGSGRGGDDSKDGKDDDGADRGGDSSGDSGGKGGGDSSGSGKGGSDDSSGSGKGGSDDSGGSSGSGSGSDHEDRGGDSGGDGGDSEGDRGSDD